MSNAAATARRYRTNNNNNPGPLKLSAAFASFLVYCYYLSEVWEWSENESTTASAKAGASKGLILIKGKLGKIDNSIFASASAQSQAKNILESLAEATGHETFVPKSYNDARHIRFGQQIHGMEVEGAALYVHADKAGNVIGVNGELVDGASVPSEPTIDAKLAIKAALEESRVPVEAHGLCSSPKLTVIRGLEDGEAHLSWTCTVRYDILGDDGFLQPFRDQIFARATGSAPGLIQIHPKIYADRRLDTRNCRNFRTKLCSTVTTNSSKIQSDDLAIDAAHNFAFDTYEYYRVKHGRDSLDDAGMTVISNVHYGYNYNNAFWDGSSMTYGDGDGVLFDKFSLAADVVAHELTHGVTEYSSGLIYQDESGKKSSYICHCSMS